MEKETQAKILLVDDNKTNLELMKVILEEEGLYIVTSGNAAEAMRKLKRDTFDLVITDYLMPPGKNGLELADDLKQQYPDTEVIIITAYGDTENAVKAIKTGAFDFIQRPINNDILVMKIQKALENKMLTSELEKMKQAFKGEMENQYKIMGSSQVIKSLVENIKVISSTESTALVTGESGVGKELFARTIHNLSKRKNEPFIALNCGALASEFMESELFGHKKGAFPDALTDKTGMLEEANGGTLLLNEVSELTPAIQVKLLKVLQDSEITPIGQKEPIKINTRIIASSNKDLKTVMDAGDFRKDLYYRLSVITLDIPPLRERKEDIPLLANYFLAKYSGKYNKNITGFSESAISCMIKYSWPGNVQELENITERATVLSQSNSIDTAHLPPEIAKEAEESEKAILPYKKAKENFDREYLTYALEYTGGNIKKAAELAQKHRTDLYDMIRKYSIDVNSFRSRGE